MAMRQQLDTDKVWDPIVRLTHGLLVVLFGVAYWLGGDWFGLHAQIGYSVALLVVLRMLWGFVGPPHARFSEFVPTPRRLMAYIYSLCRGRAAEYRGHDPAGALMIIFLLLSLAVTTLSGMTLFAMEHRGPFAGTAMAKLPGSGVEAVHQFASEATIVLAGLHVLGVLVMGRVHRQRLVRAMLTGRKWLR
jgi:cytochrome b